MQKYSEKSSTFKPTHSHEKKRKKVRNSPVPVLVIKQLRNHRFATVFRLTLLTHVKNKQKNFRLLISVFHFQQLSSMSPRCIECCCQNKHPDISIVGEGRVTLVPNALSMFHSNARFGSKGGLGIGKDRERGADRHADTDTEKETN